MLTRAAPAFLFQAPRLQAQVSQLLAQVPDEPGQGLLKAWGEQDGQMAPSQSSANWFPIPGAHGEFHFDNEALTQKVKAAPEAQGPPQALCPFIPLESPSG